MGYGQSSSLQGESGSNESQSNFTVRRRHNGVPKKIALEGRPRPAVTLVSTLEIFAAGQHPAMRTSMQRSQQISFGRAG